VNDFVPTGLTLVDSDWTIANGVATLINEVPFIAAGDNTVIPITFTLDANFQGDTLRPR